MNKEEIEKAIAQLLEVHPEWIPRGWYKLELNVDKYFVDVTILDKRLNEKDN